MTLFQIVNVLVFCTIAVQTGGMEEYCGVKEGVSVKACPCDCDKTLEGYKAKFKRDALKAHNKYRSMHGAPSIKMNGNVSKYAQEWANKLAKNGQLQHRSEHKYGENIYWGADSRGLDEMTGDKAVKSFYDEINRYNFSSGGFSSGTGHFTQVVWKDSRRLGIGVAINPRKPNEVFAVFNYDPPGNVSGKYKENVFPAKKR